MGLYRLYKKTFLLLFLMLLISACQTAPWINKEEVKQSLDTRVQEYWKYVVENNILKAYEYEHPQFKEKVSLTEYKNRFKLIRYLDAKVSSIELTNSNQGKVSIEVTHRMMLKHINVKDLKKTVVEEWVRIERVWYRNSIKS